MSDQTDHLSRHGVARYLIALGAVAAAFAVHAGASIIRAHDVAATVDAVKVAVALRGREAR